MSWNASYASSFEKDLLALRLPIRPKAVQAIRHVLANPYKGKKLQGRANRFSVRLGRDYRLVYSVYSPRGVSAPPIYFLSAATTASISLSVL